MRLPVISFFRSHFTVAQAAAVFADAAKSGPDRRECLLMLMPAHQKAPCMGVVLFLSMMAAQAGIGPCSILGQSADKSHSRGLFLSDRVPDKPSIPPSSAIPVDPLGFSAPGPIYLGSRNAMASLDFLDEKRLLFTFRIPGLLHREPGEEKADDERQIRAVVLSAESGTVETEALWTVHDRVRYLWMLKNGHFLLRDRDGLEEGDASLVIKPLLKFPGPLMWVEMDPQQQFLVTNSREPVGTPERAGDVGSPASANANVTEETQDSKTKPDLVVRILRRDSGKVMLVSRARGAVHLPINSEGYLERLRGNGQQWTVNFNYFAGGSKVIGRVDSVCSPTFDFIAQREVLITACTASGANRLEAMNLDGKRLWEDQTASTAIWPLMVVAPNGSRVAHETLSVSHSVNAYAPLDADDIKGQLVQVLNASDGKVALETFAKPPLDAGGNVAISPSGRRVAVLNGGVIQVFDLPEAPGPVESEAAGAKH
jgi:hypothetical protein